MVTHYMQQILRIDGKPQNEPSRRAFGEPLALKYAWAQVNDWNRVAALQRRTSPQCGHTFVYWIEE